MSRHNGNSGKHSGGYQRGAYDRSGESGRRPGSYDYARYPPQQNHYNDGGLGYNRQWEDRRGGNVSHTNYGGGTSNIQSWAVSNESWQRPSGRQDFSSPSYSFDGPSIGNRDTGFRDDRRRQGQGRNIDPEQQRIEGGSRFQNRQFLEDVNLPPELAFRVDTSADQSLLKNEATRYTEKSSFMTTFYRDNLLGATEEYIQKNNILSYKKVNKDVSAEESPAEQPLPGSSSASTPIQKRKADDSSLTKSVEYIVLAKKQKHDSRLKKSDRDQETGEQKSLDAILTEKREYYNSEVRKNPEDIQLWRKFVEFQDQDCADFIKTARTGKKISILETALRTNPKSSELHFDRLDLLDEISRPSEVLIEWQKLVSANQESEVVWLERFRFSSTQLQVYTSSNLLKDFEKGFQKLRTILSPTHPEYQRPAKLHLLMSDLLLALCLILRNSGYTEKAVALCQAQLEFDFNFPHQQMNMQNDKSGWKAILKLFELFWGLGTLRFGEPGYANGWSKTLEMNPEVLNQKYPSVGVADSEVMRFEDSFFEAINTADADSCMTRKEWTLARSEKWVLVESMRSKLYWTPWREKASDVTECEDSHRIILPNEIGPFLTYVPKDSYQNSFEQQSVYFRHLVNYLIVLNHDFLPRTQTVESILSPYSSIALCDSSVFFSELNYWEKYIDLYYPNPKMGGVEVIPEGYRVSEFTLFSSSCVVVPGNKLRVLPTYDESIESEKQKLLDENESKHHDVIRNIVKQSIEQLDSKFASLLVQMLFRFEQKALYARDEDHKSIIEFCKNLMQHEKLRSSIEAFGEIGLLEFFGGRKKKSISFLVKTVNSSLKILKESDINSTSVESFLNEHWETVTQLTKLYRLIAEFHVKDSPSVALSVLVSLGNQFDLISLPCPSSKEDAEDAAKNPSKMAILKAKRFFESVLNHLVPVENREKDVVEIDCEDVNVGIFEKWDGGHCLDLLAQQSNLIIEWTVAFSLFTFLTEAYDGASEIYQRVIDKLETLEPLSRSNKYSPQIVNGHHIREQLYVSWCKLGALFVSQHPMQNGKFRNVFGKALERYPSSPPLLMLYTTVESQCSVVGKLWRSMVNTIKQKSPANICTLDWAPIFMCFSLAKQMEEIEQDSAVALDEFGIGGPAVPPDTIFYKLDALFSAAENNFLTQNCPLIWRLHLKHLAIRAKEGKDQKRAHGLFYEAIRRCPTNKAIYMDAIAYFPEMMKEITDIMAQKELVVRLPIEELDLLLQFNNQAQLDIEKASRRRSSALEDGETVSDEDDVVVLSD